MAMFHLHHGFVSRSTGRSSVQSAAYICGEKLHEDYRNKDADYSNRGKDVALVKTLAPEHSKYKDLSVWNEIENFENRYAEFYFKKEEAIEKYKSCAQTASTIVLALPNEFSIKICEELLDKFIDIRFTSRGLITTYAIHNAEGNLHAHLQISRRAVDESGEFLLKKEREICARGAAVETRELFADLTNEFLEREGFDEQVTAKSFEDLGINLEATKHRGYYADQLGTDSRIAQENIEILKENEERLLSDPSIIIDLLNEKKAVFTQKDILKEIVGRVFDGKNVSVIFENVLETSIHVGENINGEFLYTGEKYQKLESDVLSKFDTLSSQTAKTSVTLDSQLSIINEYDFLSEEQKSAVIGLTKDNNFGILLGKAGAGKTTTMKAISEIYEHSGARVIGMSLSAVASENLGKDAEIESATIASWSHRWRTYETAKEKFLSFDSVVTDGVLKQLEWYNDLQRYEQYQLKSGDVIIIDEAGMVGTKEWKAILDAADNFNAKIIAVGDDNQFKPISAGDILRVFINSDRTHVNDIITIASDDREHRRAGIFELSEIRRQKEPWMREASVELSKLNVGTALERYEHHGNIHAIDNAEISKRIAEKYCEIREMRNELAKEILSNRPLHREFVSEMSRECFISFKAMENQVSYDEKMNPEKASSIVHDGIGKESKFLQDIGEMKALEAESGFIVNTRDFIRSEQSSSIYKLSLEAHRDNEGYGLYVSNSMLDTYIGTKGIEVEAKEYINEYASMLVQKTIDEQKLKEVSPELLESCIKQAVCFEALKQAIDQKELTHEMVNTLHSKAHMLSEKLGDYNIHVLNDNELMKQANDVIEVKEAQGTQSLPENNAKQIIDSNAKELIPEGNSLNVNERSFEDLREIVDKEPSYTIEEPEISRDRGMCR